MQVQRLSTQESAAHGGANLIARITHADLTTATVNTAQVLTLTDVVPNGDAMNGGVNCNVYLRDVRLVEKFEDTATAANNDLQVKVGDSADDDQFLTATQINVNGTEVTNPSVIADPITAAATSLTATFTPAGGYGVLTLNKGIIDLYFFISDMAL